MVKKLFKHEFIAWLRITWVAALAVLTLAGAHRLLQLFETDSPIYILINVLFLLAYFLTLMVALCFPTFFAMIRFYKNLFTGEGYLSFTLPVTPTQHLWVKSLTATVMSMGIGIVCLLSGLIITAGDVFTEIWKLAAYYLGKLNADQTWNVVFGCLETVLMLLVSTFSGHLLYYACICLGQRFRKNRLLASVGIYFAYYYISQIFGIILGVVMEVLEISGALSSMSAYMNAHVSLTVHVSMLISLVLSAVQGVVCFLICRHTMTKKLNLE